MTSQKPLPDGLPPAQFDSMSGLPRDQRWHGQMHPTPVVVALIRDRAEGGESTRFLLIRRNVGPYTGQWALVVGKWDFGETLDAAIVREVREETALETKFVALRALISERVVPWQAGDLGAHFLIFVCELAVESGRATEQTEGIVAWFTRPQLDGLKRAEAIIPSDYAMIEQFALAEQAAPYVEVEMLAPLDGSADRPVWLRSFRRHEPPPR
jgi:ADP-ribose pyrophosphatase YjhB (NUDIX family)